MHPKIKRFLALFLLLAPIVAVYYAVQQFSPRDEIEKLIVEKLTAAGIEQAEVDIGAMSQSSIHFSRIAFKKGDINVEAQGLQVNATQLVYGELFQGNYSNIAATWVVDNLSVTGMEYALPALSGNGTFTMKENTPTLDGSLKDKANTHAGSFVVTPKEAVLRNIRVLWNDAELATREVHIALGGDKQPIRIPLRVARLPLTTVLTAVAQGKATASGLLAGNVDLIIYPDGTITASGGTFSVAEGGVIQLSADALPGDSEQLQIARNALSNFHYKNLSMQLTSPDKNREVITLNVEGNNPDLFDGRPIKLNVNLSGNLLELIQQTLLPMADPAKLLQQEKK